MVLLHPEPSPPGSYSPGPYSPMDSMAQVSTAEKTQVRGFHSLKALLIISPAGQGHPCPLHLHRSKD